MTHTKERTLHTRLNNRTEINITERSAAYSMLDEVELTN